MKNKNVTNLVYAAAIAAIYVVLTGLFAPISFREIQVRVSEVLCILPIFTPAAIPGLFVGCFLGNFLSGAVLADVIFGSLASLIGAVGTYMLRRNRKIAWIAPVISNAVIVPFVLRYAYGVPTLLPLMVLTVAIGEIISVGIFGNTLRVILEKYEDVLFKKMMKA